MLPTIIYAIILVAQLVVWAALWAWLLRVGLHWANVPGLSSPLIILVTAIVLTLQVSINAVLFYFSPDWQLIVLGLLDLGTAVLVPCTVIRVAFKSSFIRAFQVWLPTILANAAPLALDFLVIRPFHFESYTSPSNSMAPTLVGPHWKGICPECGKPNYCSPRSSQGDSFEQRFMICEKFHVATSSNFDKQVHGGDHFLVAKFLSPRRWDLVAFQDPAEPGTFYVDRLVGLPGEEIQIRDGSIWVDGQRQIPPESIQGIEYLSQVPDWFGPDLWGSENRPALLGNDEHFVLGDFSVQSTDSRMWKQGAPGHNAFAVPKSHIKGVVSTTFWPIHRLRIHPRSQSSLE